jgi:WD40 repeat protein
MCHVDVENRAEQRRFKAFSDGITALAFSPDGLLLASGAGYSEQEIKLWAVSTGAAAGELVGHRSWITDLVFTQDGKTLLSSSGDQTIRLWDIPTRRAVGTLRGHYNEVYAITLANDGHTLLSGSKDGEVCLWDTRRKQEDAGYSVALTPVRFIRFLPRGDGFVSLNRDGYVGIWDAKKMQETERITSWGPDNLGIVISPDGKVVGAGDSHGNLKFWDLAARHELTNFNLQSVPSWPAKYLTQRKRVAGYRR